MSGEDLVNVSWIPRDICCLCVKAAASVNRSHPVAEELVHCLLLLIVLAFDFGFQGFAVHEVRHIISARNLRLIFLNK